MNMGLFIQTCIEQSSHIFQSNDETSNSRSNLQNYEAIPDDLDGLANEQTLMESVLSEPGMENIVHTPKVEFRLKIESVSDSNSDKRKSFETAIE